MTQRLATPFGPSFKPGAAVQSGPLLFDDFIGTSISTTANEANWHSVGSVGTAALLNGADGGFVTLVSGALATEDAIIELDGEPFIFQTGRDLYFEARFQVDEIAGDTSIFLGLAETGFDPIDGTPTALCIGFITQSDANLDAIAGSGTGAATVQDTGFDLVVNTNVVVAFSWNGLDQKLRFFVNGALVHTMNPSDDNLPDFGENLNVVLSISRSANTGDSMDIDYVLCMNDRD